MVEAVAAIPSSETQIELAYLGGAAARRGASETAFGDRSAPFIMNLLASGSEASADAGNISWIRGLFNKLRPAMKPGVYVNFMSGDEFRSECMKANLLPTLFCLLCVFFAQGLVARPAGAAAPAGRINAQQNANGSAASNIEVERWVKPKSGWLYVLDPKPDGGPAGRVWLVDPETGKVMGSIRTGDNADFALSPDGNRLYVASITEGDSSELAVIDTAQGPVIQSGTVKYREVADVLPAFSDMAVSGDGLALRIVIDAPKSADADSFLLATFDTQSGEFLLG
jgi:hypothetical protein